MTDLTRNNQEGDSQDRPEVFGYTQMELSVGQQFELEKMSRAIDNCNDIAELKSLAKHLTSSWMTQQAAIAWMLRLQMERNGSEPHARVS